VSLRERSRSTYANALDHFCHDVALWLELLVHSTASDKYNWTGWKEMRYCGTDRSHLQPESWVFTWVITSLGNHLIIFRITELLTAVEEALWVLTITDAWL
jgi:hypothetical protein